MRSSSDLGPGSASRVASAVKPLDRLLEAIALDEPHRVIRPPAVVGAQPVHRDDPRVLQPAGDLGLDEKTLAADRVVGVVVEDLLERHLTVQLAVEGDEDRPQAASGMRPEDAEPLAVARRRADGIGSCAVGVVVAGRSAAFEPTWPSVASMSGSPIRARFSFVDLPAGTAARLFSRSPRGLPRRLAVKLPAAPLCTPVRSPRPSRWSARPFDLLSVQAWNAATS